MNNRVVNLFITLPLASIVLYIFLLAAAMGDGNILDRNSLPKHYSLKTIIKDSLYADNLIFSYDDASTLTKDVVSCTLILNAFSFKIHEAFSNLPSQLLEIENIV